MKTNIFSSKAFSSFIMVCVYFLFIYFISDFIYAGNDDRGLIYILSGHNADASYYTQFMSWYISMLLAGLYTLAPAFPFMGCLFLLCMFISVWYVTYYILQKSKSVSCTVLLIRQKSKITKRESASSRSRGQSGFRKKTRCRIMILVMHLHEVADEKDRIPATEKNVV